MKNKVIAIILALFLGIFGAHKFYLGEKKQGILYLILCWTAIPFILGIIDAIIILTMSSKRFNVKYNNFDSGDKFTKYSNEGVYKIDNGSIVVSRVISDISGSKDDIYIRVKNFFTHYYKDSNSVIQVDDKESGVIIGKGLFKTFWNCTLFSRQLTFDSCHILRVDIKNERVRILCSTKVINYIEVGEFNEKEYIITEYTPFTKNKIFDKMKQKEVFIRLVDQMILTVLNIENACKGGIVDGENDNW